MTKGSSIMRDKGTAIDMCSPMKEAWSGSCHVERQLGAASFKMSQPVPSSSWVMIDLTKEEDCDDVLNRRGATPDYEMELDSNEELLKGEALEWSHTLASIPKGAKHQGKVRNLAHNEIEAELSQLCKDYMAHNVSHKINDPALKSPSGRSGSSLQLTLP
jgi:hypothetical protein